MPSKLAAKSRQSEVADQAAGAMSDYFCRVAETLGLPRSLALIYHALFAAEKPLSVNEIAGRSGLSKPGTSAGLKRLEGMRAVEVVFVPANPSTHYRPELSLRRLAAGFVQQSLRPGLETGGRLLDAAPPSDDPALPAHLKQRLSSLRHWHRTSADLLPMLAAFDKPGQRD